MSKRLALLWATLLCVCGLTLAACGGTSKSGDAGASGGAAAEKPADPSEKFLGEWKLAAIQTEGITVVGDFSIMMDTDAGVSLTLEKDGTGAMAFDDESGTLSWKLVDDNSIELTIAEEGEQDDDAPITVGETVKVTYEDGVLSLPMDDDDMQGTLLFSADGTVKKYPEIDTSTATEITSRNALVGEWKLTGMNFSGASMYGDADSIAAIVGESTDPTIVVPKEGPVTLMGDEAELSVSGSGATVSVAGTSVPIKALGDDIIVDLSEMTILGDADIVMRFSK